MTYKEVLENIENYRRKMIDNYCQANDSIEFKKGEVICRQQFINGKKSFKEYVCVTNISLNTNGELDSYELSYITPKGRISKVKRFYWYPWRDNCYTCSDGRKVKEILSHRFISIKEYNDLKR